MAKFAWKTALITEICRFLIHSTIIGPGIITVMPSHSLKCVTIGPRLDLHDSQENQTSGTSYNARETPRQTNYEQCFSSIHVFVGETTWSDLDLCTHFWRQNKTISASALQAILIFPTSFYKTHFEINPKQLDPFGLVHGFALILIL